MFLIEGERGIEFEVVKGSECKSCPNEAIVYSSYSSQMIHFVCCRIQFLQFTEFFEFLDFEVLRLKH